MSKKETIVRVTLKPGVRKTKANKEYCKTLEALANGPMRKEIEEGIKLEVDKYMDELIFGRRIK